jgi:coenzyme F420-reducing hydrogenase delta subunit
VKCQKVVDETLQIMKLLGIDERRLHLKWISASEGGIFAEQIRSFTQRLRDLGPGHRRTAAPGSSTGSGRCHHRTAQNGQCLTG